jgi:hypothetical protein
MGKRAQFRNFRNKATRTSLRVQKMLDEAHRGSKCSLTGFFSLICSYFSSLAAIIVALMLFIATYSARPKGINAHVQRLKYQTIPAIIK